MGAALGGVGACLVMGVAFVVTALVLIWRD
jgi:hypothetical protein